MLHHCNEVDGHRARSFFFSGNRARIASSGAGGISAFYRLAHWFVSLCLLMLAFGANSVLAGPSVQCPPNQSFTVASGGTFKVNQSNCSIFGFTLMPVPPSHGSIPNVAGNGDGIVYYTNNGDGATSDTFTLRDDSAGDIVFTVTVLPPSSPITVTPASMPAPMIGAAFSQTIVATGGVAPYSYTTTGPLPAGISLNASGVLSGTPTATGVFVFGIKVTDSTAGTALTTTKNYSFDVAHPVQTIMPATLPVAGMATAYSKQLSTSGGTPPYRYEVESGSLPIGINLSTSGLLSGTPLMTGSSAFVVKSTDSSGGGGPYPKTTPYTLVVNVQAEPTITSVSPTTGPASGSFTVIITGTNLSGATAVTFGAAAANFTVNSATQITATAPAGAGTVDVRVTTGGGTSATSAADQITYVPAPTVSSISPTSGPAVGGTSVIITGTNLSGATTVYFGGTAANTFTVNSANQITATAPAGTGTVDVRVATSGGTSATSAADQYTYLPVPTVSSISPTSGPATGGTSVIITGTNLSGATAVNFGATAATNFTVNSATQITATAPAGTGTVDVRVTTGSGTSATSAADQYTYLPVPTVSSISPSSGPTAGGTSVTITGTNFSGVTSVQFGATLTTFTVNSATSMTVSAPAGSAGTVDVRVTTGSGTSATSAADQFTYVSAPTVSGISPATGTSAGGTTVTITGSGFSGTTAVTFGATAATSFTVSSATQITATAPAGTGTVDIRVTTGGGTSATSAADQFTYIGAPAVTSISPTAGPAGGGTTVTITGTNLSGATAVRFGATNATGFTVSSPTSITATAPAGTGTVDVRVTTGGGTSATSAADQFSYQSSPIAGAVIATAPYGSSANPITLNLSGGPATSVAVASAASHGTATASGTTITYTPTAGYGGPDSFTYTVTNSFGTSAPATVTITVAGPTITIAPSTVPATTVGAAYSQSVTASSGFAPYAYTISAGALPAGLTLNPSTGVLSGTPTAGGTFNFTVRATDSSTGSGPYSGARAYSMTVSAPTITIAPTTLSAPTAGVAYSQSISAAGGTATYSYAITGGSVPTGLSLAANGTLSGTPTAAGPYNFTVTATDSSTGTGAPYTGSRAYSFTVAAGAPVAGNLNVTVAYGSSATPINLNLSGGTATSVAVASAASHGTATAIGTSITYTPTAGYGGPDTFTYTATNGVGTSAPATVTITVAGPTITIAPSTVPAATVGAAYSQSVTASSGFAPYAYTISAGALPAGLTLNPSTGVLSGTPTAGGTFNFTVRATDSSTGSGPYSGARAYSMTVSAPTITIAPTTLSAPTAGVAYSQSISAAGGTAPHTYAITGGSVPTGLSLAANGTLSGTPTAAGSFNFTVTATDSSAGTGAPYTGSRAYSVTVAAGAPVAGNLNATVAYGSSANPINLDLSGGTATSVAVASAASHGSATASGTTITYTPTAGYAGSDSFTYTATNSVGTSVPATVTIAVGMPTVSLTPVNLPNLTAGTPYSATITAAGGTAPYTYSVSSGSLPAGLSLNTSTGVLSGTATVAGSFTFSLRAADNSTGVGAPFSVTNSYTVSIAAPTITVTPASLPAAAAATAFSQQLTASGGVAPYAYTVTSGSLPAGLNLSGSGLISGTPTAAGSFTLTVRAQDANLFTGTQSYTLSVLAASVNLTPTSVPNATAAVTYTATVTAAGGTAPYTFSVSGGSLPAGMSLNTSTGVLSGKATAVGTSTFSLRATDSSTGVGAPFSATNSYTLTVSAPTIVVAPTTLTAMTAGSTYSQVVSATGGTAPYSYAVTAGTLPAGLNLAPAGTLSGTPTAAGPYSFTITTTDSSAFTGTQAYSGAVAANPPVTVADTATTSANAMVAVPVTSNDTGVITSIALVTLPSHGTAKVNALNVEYTPASNFFGVDTLTYTATGPGGTSTAATVTITVNALAVPVAKPQQLKVLAGQPVTLNAVLGATGGPFTAVTLVTAPAKGKAIVSGTDISFTPDADGSGDVALVYTVSNVFGVSQPVTSTITVNPVPVAPALSANAAAGTQVDIDLTATATGGPFTGSAVLAVTPTNAGVATIRSVAASAGSTGAGYVMTFKASATYSGTAVIGYTLSNAFTSSSEGQVSVSVAARRDVSTDAEVAGLLAAQANTARRFASAQIGNFTRRLESLHGDGWGRSDFGLTLSTGNNRAQSERSMTGSGIEDRVIGVTSRNGMRKVGWKPESQGPNNAGQGVYLSDREEGAQMPDLPGENAPQGNQKQALAFWIGGAVDYGRQNLRGVDTQYRFTTSGISAGGDYRINDLATLGLGVGFSKDNSRIGVNGSKSSADSASAVMYGSLRPAKGVFIDGLLGYGTLSFDSTRYITDGGGTATGTRKGSQFFGSVIAGMEFYGPSWMWSPYGRLEMSQATLDTFTESAQGIQALTYFKQKVRTTNGVLGVRGEGMYSTSWGKLMPRVRVEYTRRFQGDDEARMAYADLADLGPAYVLRTRGSDVGIWTVGLGGRLMLQSGVELSLEINSSLDTSNTRYRALSLGVRAPF